MNPNEVLAIADEVDEIAERAGEIYWVAFKAHEVAEALRRQALETGDSATCLHCGKLFVFGPGTGKRRSAKYCTLKCNNAAKWRRHQARKAEAT